MKELAKTECQHKKREISTSFEVKRIIHELWSKSERYNDWYVGWLIEWLTDWLIHCKVLMPLTIFCLYHISHRTYPCFPGVSVTIFHTLFFPSHWLLSHKTIIKTVISCERGTNPVAMTNIYYKGRNRLNWRFHLVIPLFWNWNYDRLMNM